MYKQRWHPLKICMGVTKGMETADFDVWVERLLTTHGNWVTRYFETAIGPQWGEWCQFVGRTETLQEDFVKIMRLLGHGSRVESNKEEMDTLSYIGSANPQFLKKPTKKLQIVWRQDLKRQVEHEERVGIRRWYGEDTINRRVYGTLFDDKEKGLGFNGGA